MSIIKKLEDRLKVLQTSLDETRSELEKHKTKPVKKAWVHERDTFHYYITPSGFINKIGDGIAGPLNSFPDRDTAKRMLKWLKLMDKMRIAADGFNIGSDVGHFIYLDRENNRLCVSAYLNCRDPGTIYFNTSTAAYTFIDSLTEDEVKTFKAGFPVY